MQESGVMQLVVDEVITETLEADNVTLQNLSASKHVQVGLCYICKPNATSSRRQYQSRKGLNRGFKELLLSNAATVLFATGRQRRYADVGVCMSRRATRSSWAR